MTRLLVAIHLALIAMSIAVAQAAEPPNIVIILADDLAWTDPACYGHPWHETPNLDRLADEGMRFTKAYAPAPICSASRASILTGKTPARLHFEFVTKDVPGQQSVHPRPPLKTPPYTLNLPLGETTIAEVLGNAGYETAFFGKWHVNRHHGQYLGWSPTHGPRQQGFSIAIEGFGSHSYSGRRPKPITEIGHFHTDGVTQLAVKFLRRKHERPFLLMVSHYYVHTPVRNDANWLGKKYEAKVPEDTRNRNGRVEYAAFVETLDHYVGELLTALDEEKLTNSTLVVFLSDNGGHPEYAAHCPLRGSKWNLYEGGVRVPMIARWPGVIESAATCDTPVIGYDLLPTFAEAAGRPVAKSETALDGVSLFPLLANPEKQLDRQLFFHFPYYHPERQKYDRALDAIGVDDFAISKSRPHSAIRKGDHKLLYFFENDRVELYDLAADPSEQRDLSSAHPSLAASLRADLMRYLDRVDARLPVREQVE